MIDWVYVGFSRRLRSEFKRINVALQLLVIARGTLTSGYRMEVVLFAVFLATTPGIKSVTFPVTEEKSGGTITMKKIDLWGPIVHNLNKVSALYIFGDICQLGAVVTSPNGKGQTNESRSRELHITYVPSHPTFVSERRYTRRAESNAPGYCRIPIQALLQRRIVECSLHCFTAQCNFEKGHGEHACADIDVAELVILEPKKLRKDQRQEEEIALQWFILQHRDIVRWYSSRARPL